MARRAAPQGAQATIWRAELTLTFATFEGYGRTRSAAIDALRRALEADGRCNPAPGIWAANIDLGDAGRIYQVGFAGFRDRVRIS